MTARGGGGDDVYSVVAGDTVVEKAGEGIDTVEAWTTEGFRLPDHVENLTLMQAGNAWMGGNDLANRLQAGAGNNTLIGGKGNDILTGGAGSDLFVVARGDGSDTITDFSAGDVVRLDGYAFRTFADISAKLSQFGSDAVLDLGSGEALTLRGVATGSLTAADFALPLDRTGLVKTFGDDFSSFSRFAGGHGTWMTSFRYGGTQAYTLSTNGEDQLYVDRDFKGLPGSQASASLGLDPFSIENGALVIHANPITSAATPYTGGYGWTSGLITTQTSFAQTYGYFEITAELPAVQGAWPAFWLLPADGTSNSELDVFEYLGSRTDSLTSAVHANDTDTQLNWESVEGLTAGRHTFGARWTPYEIDIYVDGRQVASYATPDEMSRPMYMLANLAMGGDWGGDPAAGARAQYTIDSISAYQLDEYTLANYRLTASGASTRTLTGTAGNDRLSGGDGNDTLDGLGGIDTLAGGLGDDSYIVRSAGTVVSEKLGEGIDTVRSSVSFTLPANVENLILTGDAAISATGHAGANIITGNSSDNLIRGAGGNDVLTGGGGHDTFVIAPDDGSDILTDFEAGPGRGDTVKLDGFWFASASDIVSAMSQHGADVYLQLDDQGDTLVFRGHTVADFSANDFQLPTAPPEGADPVRWLKGTSGADALYGTPLAESLDGQGGNDILAGGKGDDTYAVGPGTTVVETAGEGIDTVDSWLSSYTLPANVENLVLMASGSSGTGNALTNRITGTSGNDTLNGKGGNDWLTGGAGKDAFVFDTRLDGTGNVDTITDFRPGTDTIVLARAAFVNIGGAGSLSASAFEASAVAHDVTDRVLYDKAAGTLFYDADGSGAGAPVAFAYVTPGLALSHSDILII